MFLSVDLCFCLSFSMCHRLVCVLLLWNYLDISTYIFSFYGYLFCLLETKHNILISPSFGK